MYFFLSLILFYLFFKCSGVHRDLHVLTLSFPTRRSSDLTHIVPLMVGDPVKAKKISDVLLAEYGVYVQPISYPTVPRGTERLRFTPGPTQDRKSTRLNSSH